MTHGELQADLAHTFDPWKNVVFQNPRLGPFAHGVPVPDLFVFAKSYKRTNIRVYEVKASRSDLLSDVRAEKWEKYLPYCDRIYFALRPDIEWKDLLENQPVGIMVRGSKGWKTVRQAPANAHRKEIPETVFLALIFSHLERFERRDSRLSRLEAERAQLLKSEIRDIYQSRNTALNEWARELSRRERQIAAVQEDARRAAIEEIRNALGIGEGGYWGDPLEKLLRDILIHPVEQAIRAGRQKLIDLLKGESADDKEAA